VRSLSLRNQMVIAIAGLIVVLGTAGTIHARFTLSSISHDELDQRELAIARDLESHSAELLLTNDIFGLYRRISELATANSDVRYALLLDSNGVVRASTFATGLPAGLRTANAVTTGEPYSLTTLSTSEGQVRDLAYPIQEGKLGVIRLGLSTQHIEGQINRLTVNLLGLTALALIGGLVASYFLATFLTRPLSRLAEAARAVSRGEHPVQAELYGHPEVGQVAMAFDQMTDRLRTREEERSQLLSKVITAEEDERRRISRELHDEAGQALTSVLLGLSQLEPSLASEVAREKADDLRATTQNALTRLRDMARELRPSTLDDLGLPAALSRYVADYGSRHGLETHFHSAGLDTVRLKPETETALYRIVQEALTNVSRHAEATTVNVLLERRDGHAVVVVEDDGVGFDPALLRASTPANEKLGLLGMEERASLVGGQLTIESQPGRGAAIFVEVPVGVAE